MSDGRPAVPAWSTSWEATCLICRGVTFATSVRVAAFVGTLLSLVNQGSVIADGGLSWAVGAKIAANFMIPFLVSSVGYLAPFRDRSCNPCEPG